MNHAKRKFSPLSPRGRVRVRGRWHEVQTLPRTAHAAEQSLFLPRQEKSPKEGDPDIRPDPRFGAKTSRGPKLATLKQRTASSTFSLQISAANGQGPSDTKRNAARSSTALRSMQRGSHSFAKCNNQIARVIVENSERSGCRWIPKLIRTIMRNCEKFKPSGGRNVKC